MKGFKRLLALVAIACLPVTAMAEDDPFAGLGAPAPTSPKSSKITAFSAFSGLGPATVFKSLAVEARLTAGGEPLQQGLVWRVFSPYPGSDGKLPLVASSKGGSASFNLAPGDYFINCAFGRAGVTKKVTIPVNGEPGRQSIVLDAGGLVLSAVAGVDQPIPPDDLRFSIHGTEVGEDGERALIIDKVRPDTIVGLNSGTYHVTSEYGTLNAVVRADLQVEAGKLTQVSMQHRAARIVLKLVSHQGGEAIADTAWSVLTASGDSVYESVSAFSTLVLSEGEYFAVARNKNKIYQRPFTVRAGRNIEVEVLMRETPDMAGSLRGAIDGN